MLKISDLIDFNTAKYNWNAIEDVPEFAQLKNCPQNPKWHGEGNAWEHTKRVCEEAVKIFCGRNKDSNARALLTSALFHDIGKGTTSFEKDGIWHSYGHEIEGQLPIG